MTPPTFVYTLNSHVWRRFDLAQQNMLKSMRRSRRKRNRRVYKWAMEMRRWCDKL